MSHRADTACGIDRQTKWNQYTLQKLCCAEGIIMAQFTEESILVSQILKKKICENLSVIWSKNTAFTLQQIKEHQHVENSPLHKEKKHVSVIQVQQKHLMTWSVGCHDNQVIFIIILIQ